MSNREKSSLDDTLPIEKKESGTGSLKGNEDNYGSDLSLLYEELPLSMSGQLIL